jgi:hypothetical protein
MDHYQIPIRLITSESLLNGYRPVRPIRQDRRKKLETQWLLRIASSGMLRRVALVRTEVSEELRASIRVTRNGELGTTIAVTNNRRTLQKKFQVMVLTRATRRNIAEDAILHSHRRENLTSYITTIQLSMCHSIFKPKIARTLAVSATAPQANLVITCGLVDWCQRFGVPCCKAFMTE